MKEWRWFCLQECTTRNELQQSFDVSPQDVVLVASKVGGLCRCLAQTLNNLDETLARTCLQKSRQHVRRQLQDLQCQAIQGEQAGVAVLRR